MIEISNKLPRAAQQTNPKKKTTAASYPIRYALSAMTQRDRCAIIVVIALTRNIFEYGYQLK